MFLWGGAYSSGVSRKEKETLRPLRLESPQVSAGTGGEINTSNTPPIQIAWLSPSACYKDATFLASVPGFTIVFRFTLLKIMAPYTRNLIALRTVALCQFSFTNG
jgi:hypothetical protein